MVQLSKLQAKHLLWFGFTIGVILFLIAPWASSLAVGGKLIANACTLLAGMFVVACAIYG
jgi:hypothetical protein